MACLGSGAKLIARSSSDNQEVLQMPTATEKRKAPKKVKVAKGEQSPVEKTTELSERVLKQVEHGQKRAIEAVRDFMESVDKALPPHGKNPSRRQDVIDSALEMSEKLVDTQYDFLQSVVHSAGETLGATNSRKR